MRAAVRIGSVAARVGGRSFPLQRCSAVRSAAHRGIAVPARHVFGPTSVRQASAAPAAPSGARGFGGGVVARALRAAAGIPARAAPAGRRIAGSGALRRAPGRRRFASSAQPPKPEGGASSGPKAADAAGTSKAAPRPDGSAAQSAKAGAEKASGAAEEAASEGVRIAEHDADRWGAAWPAVRAWRWCSAQLKELWKRYGWLTVLTWLGIYNVFLWGLFGARRAGLIRGMDAKDVEKWLNGLSLKKRLLGPEPVALSPVAMDFLIAWLLVKTTEPIRAVAVVLTVPVLVRRLPPWLLFRLGAKHIPGKTGGPGL